MLAVSFVRLRSIGAHAGRLRSAPIVLPSSSPVTLKVPWGSLMPTVSFVRLRSIGAHAGRLRSLPIVLSSSSPVTLKMPWRGFRGPRKGLQAGSSVPRAACVEGPTHGLNEDSH